MAVLSHLFTGGITVGKSPTSRQQKQNARAYGIGNFVSLPKDVITCPNFQKMAKHSKAYLLLLQLAEQFNGKNNGDLSCAFSVLRNKGWTSNDTLSRMRKCLLHYGFITETRAGGRNQCSLFALAWESIDPCDGKIDVHPTTYPSRKYAKEKEEWTEKN